jgi:hypothetical protein
LPSRYTPCLITTNSSVSTTPDDTGGPKPDPAGMHAKDQLHPTSHTLIIFLSLDKNAIGNEIAAYKAGL